MEFIDHEVPVASCPQCDYTVDRASGILHASAPKAGDFTVCISCAEVLRFGKGLTLRITSATELAEFALQDPKGFALLMLTQRAIKTMRGYDGMMKKNRRLRQWQGHS